MDRLLLRAADVANLLGLGRSKVYELMAAGQLPTIRIGHSVRVPAQALEEWVARQVEDQVGSDGATSDRP